MTTSDKRIAANRANAKKSTGPRTAAGKRKSSRNAQLHGILSRDLVIATEDPREYDALLNGLIEAHDPQGAAEQLLVEKIAIALWKMKRLNAVETASISYSQMVSSPIPRLKDPAAQKILNDQELIKAALPANDQRLIRYQSQLEGQYYRAMATLHNLQIHREQKEAIDVAAEQVEPGAGD